MTAVLLSQNAFAKYIGKSRRAVQKAVARGRITVRPDGLIDAEQAVREWEENTHHGMARATREDDLCRQNGAALRSAPAGDRFDYDDPDRILSDREVRYLDSLTDQELARFDCDEPLTLVEAALYKLKWQLSARRPARRRARA